MSEYPSFYQQQLDPLSTLAINAVRLLNSILATAPAVVRGVSEPSAAWWATYSQPYLYQLEVPAPPQTEQLEGTPVFQQNVAGVISQAMVEDRQLEEYRQRRLAHAEAKQLVDSQEQAKEDLAELVKKQQKQLQHDSTVSSILQLQNERQIVYEAKQAKAAEEKQYRVRMGFER